MAQGEPLQLFRTFHCNFFLSICDLNVSHRHKASVIASKEDSLAKYCYTCYGILYEHATQCSVRPMQLQCMRHKKTLRNVAHYSHIIEALRIVHIFQQNPLAEFFNVVGTHSFAFMKLHYHGGNIPPIRNSFYPMRTLCPSLKMLNSTRYYLSCSAL